VFPRSKIINCHASDEALEYLEIMKHLGDDDENVDCDATTTITGKGVSRSQQQQQQATSRTTNGRHRKGAKQALRGPDGVAYRLAISACARAPGGQRWQDGIRLLREMKDVALARKLAAEEISSSSSTAKNSTISGTDCAPDVMAYTAAIAGCSEAGEYIHAISLISEMRREGIQPNVVTFSAVINACATASAKLARSRREDEESTTGSSTSSGGSRFMYESIAGLESVRLPMNRALRLLEAMKSPTSSVRPNIVTYNAAIRACAEGFNLDGAFDLLRQLKEDGMEPTIVTYGSLMTACERVGDIEAASRVFRMVKEEGTKNKDNHVDVDSHSSSDKNGSQEQIIQVNEIIYGAAISCCRKAQQPERALFLLRKMMDEKLAPNTATFNTVIAALAENQGNNNNNNNNNSRDIVDATTKNNNNNNNNSYDSTLLLEKALAVYRVMKSKHAPPGGQPNRKTYNILIRCLSSNLQPGYAESLLIDMRNDGFVPDVDLYTMTVRSYEKCGNPMKALGLMERMREMGYDFYKMKVLDDAFKSGVKILNRMGKGFSSTDGSSRVGGGDTGFNTDGVDGRGALCALSEESIAFDDYD
jgi:pentatricopeptide repeat protein